MDLVRLGEDGENGKAVVNKVMNFRIPYHGWGGFLDQFRNFSFSIRNLIHGVSFEIIYNFM